MLVSIIFLIIGFCLIKNDLIIGLTLITIGIISIIFTIINLFKKPIINDEILNDFNNSKSILDDRVRLGNKYIFRNKYDKPILISDVKDTKYVEMFNENTTNDISIYLILKNNKQEKLSPLYGPNTREQYEEVNKLLNIK